MIRKLSVDSRLVAVGALAEVLADCVEGGASVGFVHPFSVSDAEAYWRRAAPGMDVLLIAGDGDSIDGTVSLRFAEFPNALHRAEVLKLLIHRRARGRGLATALMKAVETEAAAAGRSTLVLDTATGTDAERLYLQLGWEVSGVVPRYCLMPDGTPNSTTVMHRLL